MAHISNKKSLEKSSYTVSSSLVNYYLLIMFSFFPMFLTAQYSHARTDKYYLFLILSGILTVSILLISVFSLLGEKRNRIGSTMFVSLSVTDYAMLSFFVFALISTLVSDHRAEAINAAEARNNGLILIAVYTIIYFIVSRHYVFKEYVLAAYLVFSSFVSLLTTLNFFYIDPFGLLNGYSESVVEDFGSTIGNKNTIASFICLCLPAALAVFIFCSKRYLRVLSGVSVVISYTGLLCANSNSGFLGLAATLAALAILSSRSYETLRRFFLAATLLFAGGKALRLFSLIMNDTSKKFEAIPKFLTYSDVMYIPIAVFAVIFVLMTALKNKKAARYKKRAVTAFFVMLTVIFTAGLAAMFLYFSIADTESDLGIWSKLLRFNEKWGTHRGFMWIYGIKEYLGFDIVHKLFGSGPDTFYYVFEPHFDELLKKFGDSSTDCIHNEYLNYLITQGILGLASYISLLIFTVARGVKASYRSPVTLVFISAVIGYAAQAVVNLYQPITTPLLILFISVTEGVVRNKIAQTTI